MNNIFDNPTKYINDIVTKVRISDHKLKTFGGKTMAFVFFTKFCDVQCSHCFFRSDNEGYELPREQYEFSDEGFEKFITFINSSNNGYLSILGGGEPFKKFEYIKETIKRAKTDRIVVVTSGMWADNYNKCKDMIYEMYEALLQRENPTKVVLRVSVDKWHLLKIDINCIFNIIDVFKKHFSEIENFELQLHTLTNDNSIDKIMGHYQNCTKSIGKKYISDNEEIFKIGLYRYYLNFSDGYKISVGVAQIFNSNLKVNLKKKENDLKQLIEIFDNDMKYNSYSNPSLVLNKNKEWGLDFLISYNGNVATWGNEQLYSLNNLYTDSYENIISKIYNNIISYSLLDKGYFYRTKIIDEINPLAVLRSKAINIRDYAGAIILEENHTVLYYAIRVIQDYMKENVISLEDISFLPQELLDAIQSGKMNLKKMYKNSHYSIITQYMEKDKFNENEWRDLFNLIYCGHYELSDEQISSGIEYYNSHAYNKINSLEEVLENSKEHYQRLIERLTFMKPEAKKLLKIELHFGKKYDKIAML